MSQSKTLEKIFKILDEQISAIAKKSSNANLPIEDLVQLETLVRVYSIANNAMPKEPGRPPKTKNLDYLSDSALGKYAKSK